MVQRRIASVVKEECISALPTLIETITNSIESRGGHVKLAKNADDAREQVVALLRSHHVRRIVKSKSMTTEEIGLDDYLERDGFEIVSTDLGERAVQLAGDKPAHIVAPAIHFTREDFARLFREKEGAQVSSDPEEITKVARSLLRAKFLGAEAAISGANLLIAETGTVVLVTNEGNGRLGPSIPGLYISVAGVEKIVRNTSDASSILELLARSATGQSLTVYTTFTSPPQVAADGHRQEFYLVLIDNGRLSATKNFLAPALKCIRCGACLNTCPTFNCLGGHVFGDIYTGPMGVLWTSITQGVDKANEFSDLCISCGLCSSVCPTEIPLAEIISDVKSRGMNRRGRRISEKLLTSVEKLDRAACLSPRLWNKLSSSSLASPVMPILGLDRRRRALGVAHPLKFLDNLGAPDTTLIYFSDVFARYHNPAIAIHAKRVSNELGHNLYFPTSQVEAGMPYLSYGMVQSARRIAKKNIELLWEYVNLGYRVVVTEPTALYILREVYPRISPSKEADAIASNSYSLGSLVLEAVESGKCKLDKPSVGAKVFYHSPCHARAVEKTPYSQLLELSGYTVTESDVTCCGMGGTFGYKKGALGYELSMVVGKELFEQLKSFGEGIVTTDSSVCSIQMSDGAQKTSVHPLQLLKVLQ
jgi:iron-sulfur cluster protein